MLGCLVIFVFIGAGWFLGGPFGALGGLVVGAFVAAGTGGK